MIPDDWEPYEREDAEHVGYLAPAGDELVQPMTLVGTALAEPSDRFDAEQVLEAVGLSYLADRWELTDHDGSTRRVVLLEVSPEQVVVADAGYAQVVGAPRDVVAPVELPNPSERLRRL